MIKKNKNGGENLHRFLSFIQYGYKKETLI